MVAEVCFVVAVLEAEVAPSDEYDTEGVSDNFGR